MSQREIDQSQAYLAAIIESSDDAIISKDLNGIVRSFNPAAERMFGYKADEIIGRPITLLIPPERIQEEVRILDTLRRGERVDHFETVRVTKDGRPLEISLTVSPVRDVSGRIVGASKIARDITERNRAARELAAQQAWFRSTLASIGDGVIACDPEGRVTFMNPVAETLTGWSTEQASGRPLTEVFHIINEKTRAPVDNPAHLVMRHGVVMGLANHTVLVARDGRERPIADSAAPILDNQQSIIGVVAVFHDVTEQRRAQAAIAEQREWLRITLASIGDAVIATDIRGHIEFMNPVAEHLTGWKADDARGRACDDVFRIVNEMTRLPAANPIGRVLTEGVVVGLANHTVLIAADGTERAIDDSAAPIRDLDEKVAGVVLVFRDVTERRRAEADRHAIAQEREELLVSERKARAEAERANRVKDDFVAMVSHELRTPLSAIVGWTDVLQAKTDDAAIVRHGLEVIARNAGTQAQLVSDLLDMSRIASEKLRLELERVELPQVLVESLETVERAAEDQGVIIRTRVDKTLPTTVGDPERLKQVFWNLLSNAIKFTPRGGHVEVVLRGLGAHAELVVKDTGIGIPPGEIAGLFERFRQPGTTTRRRYGGLGLGLAISRHLLELHGGTLRAESEGEGKGATFIAELPLTAPAEEPGPVDGAGVARTGERPSLQGTTVLVVEDEADMREMVRMVLEDHGARVLSAATAPEALERIGPGVDILLSDIRLPDMDGYELIRQIRDRDDEVARIPAVALTAFARSEDRARAMRAGFQSHIAKPFDPSELVLTIASFAEIIHARRRS